MCRFFHFHFHFKRIHFISWIIWNGQKDMKTKSNSFQKVRLKNICTLENPKLKTPTTQPVPAGSNGVIFTQERNREKKNKIKMNSIRNSPSWRIYWLCESVVWTTRIHDKNYIFRCVDHAILQMTWRGRNKSEKA